MNHSNSCFKGSHLDLKEWLVIVLGILPDITLGIVMFYFLLLYGEHFQMDGILVWLHTCLLIYLFLPRNFKYQPIWANANPEIPFT